MRKNIVVTLVLILAWIVSCRSPEGTIAVATPTVSPTPIPSSTSTATPVVAVNPTAVPTHTAAPTSSPTATRTSTPFLPDTLVGPVALRQPAGHIPWYRDDGLWLVDPETGDLQRAQMAAEVAAWSPDGSTLAVLEPPLPGQETPVDVLILTLYDLAAGQRRTYPNVYLAPHGGVAWQTVDDVFTLYAIPSGEPACLLRFNLDHDVFQQVLCAEEKGERFAGDIVALPDGRLAHVVISAGRVDLRLVDPKNGIAQHIPLWTGSKTAPALHVPLTLSPDGRLLAALLGPDADPGGELDDRQGFYLLDLDAGDVQPALTLPGLRWMAWSPDGAQLALAGDTQRFGLNTIFVYNRTVGRARSLDDAVNSLDLALLSSSPASGTPVGIPLAWTGDGRLLVGLHRRSGDVDVVHPRLAWVQVETEAVSFSLPFEREPGDWPIYTVQEVDLAVRYPPAWVVQEWQPHSGDGFAPVSYTHLTLPTILLV